jgi:predicted amidohydrolase YtcJ
MMRKIYCGGEIITMERETDCPEAVLTEEGMIRGAGPLRDLKEAAPDAQICSLDGHCLLPGFIDPHSHITALAQSVGMADLSKCSSLAAMEKQLRAHAEQTPRGQWIVGFGYDHNRLQGQKHPPKEDLDRISEQCPILISHASGHMGVGNSAALAAMGISAGTPDPAGGKIGRDSAGEPNGYLEEAAFFAAAGKIPAPSVEQRLDSLEKAQEIYLSHGITTAQDGLVKAGEYQLLAEAARKNRLILDVVGYAEYFENAALLRENPREIGRFRMDGYKIILDGSPQGRTAWMSRPYAGETEYRGYPTHSMDEVAAAVAAAEREGVQLLAHCNGDAAAEQFLAACTGKRFLRPVMIHAQFLRRDQLPAVKRCGMIPSFFAAHLWYWGDIHLENTGRERADWISPIRSAIDAGIPFTLHQDTPVILPDMLETIACAVERRTSAGVVLGESERVSPYEALCGVTKNAAFQYSKEDRIGTIASGKQADFAILEKNPLHEPDLWGIRVLETIKGGESVWRI